MVNGIRQMNNPERVPLTLTRIDGPQEGEPRVIHPVAVLVGRQDATRETMNTYQDANAGLFEVPEDGTFQDDGGNPFQYFKGDRLPYMVARRFEAFRSHIDEGGVVPGLTDARALPGAPENRMEPAPENRDGTFVTEEDLTPAQKAARTRAENKAKEEADGDSNGSGA